MSPVPQQRSRATVSGRWRRVGRGGRCGSTRSGRCRRRGVVGAVVGGGDGVEHLLDVRGGSLFGGDAGGAGSGGAFVFGFALRWSIRMVLDASDVWRVFATLRCIRIR